MIRIVFHISKLSRSNVSYHILSEVKDSSPILKLIKERVIGRLKEFRILKNILSLIMIDLSDQIWVIAAGAIVNMQPPLIK